MSITPVRFKDSVRVRLGADRGFLFDERTGRVYSLNASAAVAAAGLRDERAEAEVIATVVEAFDVDDAVARRDFARFVAHLVEEGLAHHG
jgi:hypothetical protein